MTHKFTRFVLVESPYLTPKVSRAACVRYAIWCCYDSLQRGECQIASHLFWTQFIGEDEASRNWGLAARDYLAHITGAVVARYVDLGQTPGMFRDSDCVRVIETRELPDDLLQRWGRGEYPPSSLRPEVVG